MPTDRDVLQQIYALAKQVLDPPPPPPPPTTTNVSTASELMAAAKVGGTINVNPGTYVVNLVLDKPTTLRGASNTTTIFKPADILEPTIQVAGNDVNVAQIAAFNGAPDRECIVVGDFDATDAAKQPHRVNFSGMGVFAGPNGGHRGFALHGSDISVDTSQVLGFWEAGRDSQAIWICNGPGPYLINNNVLEASGENILVGGADPKIAGMNPADIRIIGNTLRKPAAWKTNGSLYKCSFELKLGLHVVFEDNTIDGWAPIVHQAPIQITVRNQDGSAPWAKVDDVWIRRTTFKNVAGGFAVNIQGSDNEHPSQQTQTVLVTGNLFAGSKGGFQVLRGVSAALILDHNTLPSVTDRLFQFDAQGTMTPLTFTNNVAKAGTYGVMGDGTTGPGLPSLSANADVVRWEGNVLESAATIKWPVGTGNVLMAKGALAPLLDPVTFKLLNGTAGY